MSTTAPTPTAVERLPLWRAIVFRIGLVLAGLMALINLINPLTNPSSLTAPGLENGIFILAMGIATFVGLVPAWRGTQWAIWLVIVSRLLEGWSAIALLFIPPVAGRTADQTVGFVLSLVVAATVVAGLVAFGLRRRAA